MNIYRPKDNLVEMQNAANIASHSKVVHNAYCMGLNPPNINNNNNDDDEEKKTGMNSNKPWIHMQHFLVMLHHHNFESMFTKWSSICEFYSHGPDHVRHQFLLFSLAPFKIVLLSMTCCFWTTFCNNDKTNWMKRD